MDGESEKRLTIGELARRIRLLRIGVEFLGPTRAADALGIQPRSLRAKLEATRGVHDDNLLLVAEALNKLATEVAAHATLILAGIGTRDEAE